MSGKNFYLLITVIAAMLMAAMAGYLWLPRADVALPLVEGCRLDRQACAATLPGGGRIEVALTPRPVPAAAPVRVAVMVEGARPSGVEVGFQGVDMNMGLHRLLLAATDDPANDLNGPSVPNVPNVHYAGETSLPVCVTGRMMWQATVTLTVGRENISVPFRFESGH
ncbi:MAG: hypothetical protein LBE33_04155 [Zoogloeaceae bacterium]|nr:hypothetical protein [Zoogloeaceae bacterium]